MVSSLDRTACGNGGQQRRVLSDIGAAKGNYVVLEPRYRPIILKVSSPVRITIHQTRDGIRSSLHMHAVSADLKVIILGRGLPRPTPIGRYPADVEAEPIARIRLRASDVLRPVHRACQVPVIVPHG